MTRSQLTCGLAAALLAGSGGAYAAPPGLLRSAGEAQAHSYFISHRIEFAPQITEITPEQRDAALVEGWHERADVSRAFRDGGGWTLPAAFIPLKQNVWTEPAPAVRRPDGGRWLLPEELIRPDR